MSEKLPADSFKQVENTSQFNKDFTENYNKDSDVRHFLEVDVQHPAKLHNFHNDLSILPERMKVEKFEKLVPNLHDKNEYVMRMRKLKEALNHGLVLKKVHKFIKFDQKSWLKSHNDMNEELRKKSKKRFRKMFFQVDEQCSFEKNHGKCENIEIANF